MMQVDRNYLKVKKRGALHQKGRSAPGEGRNGGRGNQLPGWVLILIDVALTGIVVCVFALFHHVLPRKSSNPGIDIPRPPISDVPTGGSTVESSTGEGLPSQPDTEQGMWGAKFADKFSDSVQKTEVGDTKSYISKDINVSLTKHVTGEGNGQVTYFVADIYIRNIENFRTAFAKGEYGHGLRDDTVTMAQENNAVIAISGDYYGTREEGIVIRNGKLYRDVLLEDVCVLYYDGTMETYTADEFDIDQAVNKGAYQAWSFGPKLLDNGEVPSTFNSGVMPDNPRSAIGYVEPGHYYFVLVDGRDRGYSKGMRIEELAQLFHDLGCKEAYNLDGGQSAVMAYDGELANKPAGGGRMISDILYIGEVE